MTSKKYLYDKFILLLVSVLLFLTLAAILSIVVRLGSGQGIADYYVEYRQGPSHSVRGDFSPTQGVWGILSFIWFVLLVDAWAVVLSVKTFLIKREVAIVILVFGIILVLLAAIVSNVLLGHR